MVKTGTSLHVTLGQAPFRNHAYLTYEYVNHAMQKAGNFDADEKKEAL